jgi:hypothetical protein
MACALSKVNHAGLTPTRSPENGRMPCAPTDGPFLVRRSNLTIPINALTNSPLPALGEGLGVRAKRRSASPFTKVLLSAKGPLPSPPPCAGAGDDPGEAVRWFQASGECVQHDPRIAYLYGFPRKTAPLVCAWRRNAGAA